MLSLHQAEEQQRCKSLEVSHQQRCRAHVIDRSRKGRTKEQRSVGYPLFGCGPLLLRRETAGRAGKGALFSYPVLVYVPNDPCTTCTEITLLLFALLAI